MNQVYLDSARLLTRVAPLVLVGNTFALKGGTAINLFVRDMPRLSVDLDLVFPDHSLSREQALRRINEAIRLSVGRLKRQGFQTHAPAAANSGRRSCWCGVPGLKSRSKSILSCEAPFIRSVWPR
jgi:hypothetical protein